ncbi:competence type IV pilus minor pilin ComGE [Bacillus sp. DX1.1]|uniref:competence type IV pilus minor pilin ComGE n=1 Tax=unclassified Bacillus (in: firmicutes) TaxID=185979 RepID=UPI002570DB48|nr:MULTISPECIES: competence type IV pilus minor pilin ComGE [unclassified Bacillus (in: firmicutes)]MDM5156440.1 competence type IV pilus minor pilin ComGE [Bacillus sp. DX1.1]WJE80710.1 competence type IV pilus minor pilin ComGE [Bacillus sp. DX3.1]
MKCQRGSVMLEMLVSLSLLMMTVSLLLPQTLLIMQERKNIQFRYKAQLLLKEEAAIYTYQNHEAQQKETTIDGIVYRTNWRGEEVCTFWKDVKQRRMEQCRYAKK